MELQKAAVLRISAARVSQMRTPPTGQNEETRGRPSHENVPKLAENAAIEAIFGPFPLRSWAKVHGPWCLLDVPACPALSRA